MHVIHVPPREIVAQLKAIDPGLSVAWVDDCERWGVFHGIQGPENLETYADALAKELAARAREMGYEVSLHECQGRAWEKLKDARLVCYVAEDDGTYRPLDGRTVEKLRRMNWMRENLGLRDWETMLRVKADAMQKQREREAETLWAEPLRDKAFHHVLSNILWGVKTPLHYLQPGVPGEETTNATDVGGPGVPDQGGGAEAAGDGRSGASLAGTDADDSAGDGVRATG